VKYDIRALVYIGVFAACWGAIEITVGTVLHALNLPLKGAIMTGAGLTVALVGRLYVPQRGSLFSIALVTALLKMLSVGGIVLSPMMAILVEGLIAEVVVSVAGATFTGFVIGGAVTCVWPLFHGMTSLWLVGQGALIETYRRVLERMATSLGIPLTWGFWVLVVLIAIHAGIGAIAGTMAWRIGRALGRRGRPAPGASSRA
jgi:hypothetical protein